MRQYLIFGGADSRDYGVYISGNGAFNAPARAYSLKSVPGKNGNIVGSERRLENLTVTYPAFICVDFKTKAELWRSYLLSCIGYRRLQDSYNPNEYRMALFEGPLDISPTTRFDAGEFELSFNCKPQRFLISGETAVTFTSDSSITNPTLFNSQPLIRVYGTGTVGIGSSYFTITAANEYTDVDCETMEAYKGTVSCNTLIQMQSNDFPVLRPGANGISLGTGISRVDITPRWWTL